MKDILSTSHIDNLTAKQDTRAYRQMNVGIFASTVYVSHIQPLTRKSFLTKSLFSDINADVVNKKI